MFNYKSILTDNGREFANKAVKEWCAIRGVEHKFSIPYYHKSNGRVERVNITLRDACEKVGVPTKAKLKGIVDSYNKSIHRGIGMSPNNASKHENYDLVKKNMEKYRKEFKGRFNLLDRLQIGMSVLIKNELRRGNMDDEFNRVGKIVKHLYGDIYEVKMDNTDHKVSDTVKILRKHTSQLREIKERDVGSRDLFVDLKV